MKYSKEWQNQLCKSKNSIKVGVQTVIDCIMYNLFLNFGLLMNSIF